MAITISDSLSVFGNSNHLVGFLASYEEKIVENAEAEKPLSKAPNYYAWIHIASEQVFYRIKEMIYVNEENESSFDMPYKSLLNRLLSNYEPSKEQIEAIILFAKIRHLLVHKGFPNPHVCPSSNNRDIANGYPFNAPQVNELAHYLQSPDCYPELKEKFTIAVNAISSFEKDVEHDFGFMRIIKKSANNHINADG